MASSESDDASLQRAAREFVGFWDSDLKIHFRHEEEVVLPIFSKYSSSDAPEIIETLKQHVDIRRTFREMRDNIDRGTGLGGEVVHRLADLLEKHIRYEENHLFPAVEEAMPEEELWEMNRLIVEK